MEPANSTRPLEVDQTTTVPDPGPGARITGQAREARSPSAAITGGSLPLLLPKVLGIDDMYRNRNSMVWLVGSSPSPGRLTPGVEQRLVIRYRGRIGGRAPC